MVILHQGRPFTSVEKKGKVWCFICPSRFMEFSFNFWKERGTGVLLVQHGRWYFPCWPCIPHVCSWLIQMLTTTWYHAAPHRTKLHQTTTRSSQGYLHSLLNFWQSIRNTITVHSVVWLNYTLIRNTPIRSRFSAPYLMNDHNPLDHTFSIPYHTIPYHIISFPINMPDNTMVPTNTVQSLSWVQLKDFQKRNGHWWW